MGWYRMGQDCTGLDGMGRDGTGWIHGIDGIDGIDGINDWPSICDWNLYTVSHSGSILVLAHALAWDWLRQGCPSHVSVYQVPSEHMMKMSLLTQMTVKPCWKLRRQNDIQTHKEQQKGRRDNTERNPPKKMRDKADQMIFEPVTTGIYTWKNFYFRIETMLT